MPTINLATLRVKLTADDAEYKEKISESQEQTKKFGGSLGDLGGAAKMALAGAVVGSAAMAAKAIADFTRESVVEFKAFDRQIREVYTLLPNASADAKAAMSSDIVALGTEIGRLSGETVPALYQAISAGVPQENVMDFLRVSSDAALGGVTSLETAVDGISSVVNAYGADMIDAGEASDLMFTAVKGGKTTFDELARSLFNVIPTAASLDLEFGNVTAALAAMTAQGTPTTVATTQLRQLLIELSKDGSEAAKTFEQLAGKSFVEFIAEGGNLADALAIMSQGAEESNVRLSDMFSSVEAGNAALALTGAGAAKFASELESAANAAGATEAAAAIMNDSLEHQEALAAAATHELKLLVGEAIEPAQRAWLELKRAIAETGIETLKTGRVEDDLRLQFQELGYEGEQLEMRVVAARMATMELGNEQLTAEQQTDRLARAVNLLTGEFNGDIYALEEMIDAQIASERAMDQASDTVIAYYVGMGKLTKETDEQNAAGRDLQATTSALSRAEQLHAVDIARSTAEYQRNQQAAEEAIASRAAFVVEFEAWGSVIDSVRTPVEQLTLAQSDLTAAQGEWVTAVVDNSGQIGELSAQLAADLSADQRKAYQEILGTVAEGSAEWLAAYGALQNDLTDSQRASLVAQIADLEASNGAVQSVYTGNAADAEEASARMAEANAAISASYRTAALEIALAKISTQYEEDALAAQAAFINLQAAMGVITDDEAAKLLEVAEKTDAITKATDALMEEYLTDGVLSQTEIQKIADVVAIVEENTGLTTDEVILLAKEGVTSFAELQTSAGYFDEAIVSTEESVRLLIAEMLKVPTRIDILVNYTTAGTPPPTGAPPPGAPTAPPIPAYSSGGYTGSGSYADIAGLVHRDEYVFSAAAVDNIGVGVMDAMHDVARAGGDMMDAFFANAGGGGGDTINVYTSESIEAVRDMQRYQRQKAHAQKAFNR